MSKTQHQARRLITGFHAITQQLKTLVSEGGVLWVDAAQHQKKRVASCCALAVEHGVAIRVVERSPAGFPRDWLEQGVLLEMSSAPKMNLEALMSHIQHRGSGCVLVLDGVQDPHNLGACVRTAAVFGVSAVVIPKHHSVGVTPTVERIASGALMHVPVHTVTNLDRFLRDCQGAGWWVAGLAERAEVSLFEYEFEAGLQILVMGSEGKGIRALTAKRCDALLHIPGSGVFQTLNVSVATGVTLAQWAQRRVEAL